jgi:type III secretion protein R
MQIEQILQTEISNRPIVLLIFLSVVTIAPFFAMLATSFVKIVIVLSITKQALGAQQVPPSMVIMGLSLILSIYVMYPVGIEILNHQHWPKSNEQWNNPNSEAISNAIRAIKEPLKSFMIKNASQNNLNFFYELKKQQDPNVLSSDFIILLPSFVISELTRAFQIGFIIYLPFLVIDLVVSNILMALGMQMLAPASISFPFKILLFTMSDGWHLLSKGLVLIYQ